MSAWFGNRTILMQDLSENFTHNNHMTPVSCFF